MVLLGLLRNELPHGPGISPPPSVYLEDNGDFYRYTVVPGLSLGSILPFVEEPVPLLPSQ